VLESVLFDATPDACLLQAKPDPVLLLGVLPVSSGAALPAMQKPASWRLYDAEHLVSLC
jgi:hypothetical protein